MKDILIQLLSHMLLVIFAEPIPTIAVSEYQRAYANQIRPWSTSEYIVLGTDGFGRSDTREKLRDFFEIDANHIVLKHFKIFE